MSNFLFALFCLLQLVIFLIAFTLPDGAQGAVQICIALSIFIYGYAMREHEDKTFAQSRATWLDFQIGNSDLIKAKRMSEKKRS